VNNLERDRSILDNGAYIMNYKGCFACKKSDGLKVKKKENAKSSQADVI
jgi:hypothetical protein